MVNSLLTIDMITKEAVRLFKNSNAFLQQIDRQYDSQFAREGAKIGDTLRIRLPNDYVTESGAAITTLQSTNEQQTPLTISNQEKVPVAFTSAEQALSLDDFSKRILAPAVNALAGKVAADVMGLADTVPNLVYNDVGGTIGSPVAGTWLDAGAALNINSAPTSERRLIIDPRTQARTINDLKGLFNPNRKISDQFMSGQMIGEALGFDWAMDQTVLQHTNGTYSAGTVNGASQSGSTITVNAITGTFKKGDVITFAGVNAVNRVTKNTTGELRQFVVTADVANGATSIPIYPALVPPVGGNKVAYQTVTASPANGAAITLVGGAGTSFRKNLTFRPEAFTLATADLPMYGKGVVAAARENFDGISMRMIQSYDVMSDQLITRLDILYGFARVRPEWACVVADKI